MLRIYKKIVSFLWLNNFFLILPFDILDIGVNFFRFHYFSEQNFNMKRMTGIFKFDNVTVVFIMVADCHFLIQEQVNVLNLFSLCRATGNNRLSA